MEPQPYWVSGFVVGARRMVDGRRRCRGRSTVAAEQQTHPVDDYITQKDMKCIIDGIENTKYGMPNQLLELLRKSKVVDEGELTRLLATVVEAGVDVIPEELRRSCIDRCLQDGAKKRNGLLLWAHFNELGVKTLVDWCTALGIDHEECGATANKPKFLPRKELARSLKEHIISMRA